MRRKIDVLIVVFLICSCCLVTQSFAMESHVADPHSHMDQRSAEIAALTAQLVDIRMRIAAIEKSSVDSVAQMGDLRARIAAMERRMSDLSGLETRVITVERRLAEMAAWGAQLADHARRLAATERSLAAHESRMAGIEQRLLYAATRFH